MESGIHMAEERVERRLTAILAADMVGYSRLIGADEEGTIARQKAHRAELIDPTIAEYRGRIVKLMGDGALVEFPSVVDAVKCAIAVQKGMAEREADVPRTGVSVTALESISATSSSTAKTSWATGSTSLRD